MEEAPMGLRHRIEWLAALLWATICANPGWVLSVGLHSCVLAVLSVAVFSSGRGGGGLGIEGGFGDGGGGGGGGGGGDSFETVLDPAGSTLGTTEEPSLQVQAALASSVVIAPSNAKSAGASTTTASISPRKGLPKCLRRAAGAAGRAEARAISTKGKVS